MEIIKKLERISDYVQFYDVSLERTGSFFFSCWFQDVSHAVIVFPLGNVSFPGLLTTELFPLSNNIIEVEILSSHLSMKLT